MERAKARDVLGEFAKRPAANAVEDEAHDQIGITGLGPEVVGLLTSHGPCPGLPRVWLPLIELLEHAAAALGELREEVVFLEKSRIAPQAGKDVWPGLIAPSFLTSSRRFAFS